MSVIATHVDQLSVQVTNAQGQVAGPFMSRTPAPPSPYVLTSDTATGAFSISANGANTTVSLPRSR